MAIITVRYLVVRPGAAGELPRYFWQPSSKLRAAGWRSERVPLNWSSFTDAGALEAAAIARARELNANMDEARAVTAVAAGRPKPPPATRTLGELTADFRASKRWTRLAPATQRGYLQCLRKLEEWGADAPVRAIDAVRVQRLLESLSATPAYANAVVRVLRLLLDYGRVNGWVTVNAAEKPSLVGAEPTGLIWPRQAVVQFANTADAMGHHGMADAVLLNEWIGQREADILRMPRSSYRAGTLVVRQRKTGAGVALPVDLVPHLKARLEQIADRHAARARQPGAVASTALIVSEATGRAYAADNFRHVFARVRAKLAETTPHFELDHLMPGRDMNDPGAFQLRTEDLTFMHLRHTAVTRLGEAGCDEALISSITGHSLATLPQILKRYMVRTAQAARVAFQRRIDAEAPATRDQRKDAGSGVAL